MHGLQQCVSLQTRQCCPELVFVRTRTEPDVLLPVCSLNHHTIIAQARQLHSAGYHHLVVCILATLHHAWCKELLGQDLELLQGCRAACKSLLPAHRAQATRSDAGGSCIALRIASWPVTMCLRSRLTRIVSGAAVVMQQVRYIMSLTARTSAALLRALCHDCRALYTGSRPVAYLEGQRGHVLAVNGLLEV